MFAKDPGSLPDDAKRERIDGMYQKSRAGFPEVAEISAEELIVRQEGGDTIVLVDVREPAEQAISMIDGAITAHEYEADPDAHADMTVVTYCTVGHRSGLYAKTLHAQGRPVMNLKGAILAWTHAGGALHDTSGPTKRVHVWAPKANLIASGYEPVW